METNYPMLILDQRTRIWASLRAQTLYRTVSGMMNYSKAIKLLYRVENPEVVQLFGGNSDRLERELEHMARRKFKFVVPMQRYSKFNKEEHENAEFLLRAYPDLQIAYLKEEIINVNPILIIERSLKSSESHAILSPTLTTLSKVKCPSYIRTFNS